MMKLQIMVHFDIANSDPANDSYNKKTTNIYDATKAIEQVTLKMHPMICCVNNDDSELSDGNNEAKPVIA